MEPIKKILVCLDTSSMDEDLFKYARFIANATQTVEKIYFINILRKFTLPEEVTREFPDLEKKAIEERKKVLRKGVDKYIPEKKHIPTEIIVQTGGRVKTFLKLIEKKNIDMVMMGRKTDGSGSGIVTQRMGRRCPSDLMIIPQGSEIKISERNKKHIIQVLIDFSEYSKLALELAILIAHNFKNTEIVCQHVYSVPVGYHYSGKSHDEFAKVMKSHASKKFKKFIKDLDTKGIVIREEYTLDDNEDRVNDIHALAKQLHPAGIIFGSKGVSAASSFFIGSTAEKLIKIDTEFPLIVIRKRGESKGLIEVFRRM